MLWIRRCFGQSAEEAWAGKNGDRSSRYKVAVDECSSSAIFDHATFLSRFQLPAATVGTAAAGCTYSGVNSAACQPASALERRIAVALSVHALTEGAGRRPPRGLLVDGGGGLNPQLSLRPMWVALTGGHSGGAGSPLGSNTETYHQLLEDLSNRDVDFRSALRDVARASHGGVYCAIKHKPVPDAARDVLPGVSAVELSTCCLSLEGDRQVPGLLLLLVHGSGSAAGPLSSCHPSFTERSVRGLGPSGVGFGGGNWGLGGRKVAPLSLSLSAPHGDVHGGSGAAGVQREGQQQGQQQGDAGGLGLGVGRVNSWSPTPRVGPRMPSLTTKMRLAAAARAVAAEVLPASVIVLTYSRGTSLGEVAYLNSRAREYLCLDRHSSEGCPLPGSRPGAAGLASLPARALLTAIMQYAEPYATRQLHKAASSELGFCATLKVPAYIDAAGLALAHGGNADGGESTEGEGEDGGSGDGSGAEGGGDGGSLNDDAGMTTLHTVSDISENEAEEEVPERAQARAETEKYYGLTSRGPSQPPLRGGNMRARTTMGMGSFRSASRRSSMIIAVAGGQVTGRAMSMRVPPAAGQRARTAGSRRIDHPQDYVGPELRMLSRAVLSVHGDMLRPSSAGLNRSAGGRGGRGGAAGGGGGGGGPARGLGASGLRAGSITEAVASTASGVGCGSSGGQLGVPLMPPRTSRRRLHPPPLLGPLGSAGAVSASLPSKALDAAEQELLQRLGESGPISSNASLSRPPSKPGALRQQHQPPAQLASSHIEPHTGATASSTALGAAGPTAAAGDRPRPLTLPNQSEQWISKEHRGQMRETSGQQVASTAGGEGDLSSSPAPAPGEPQTMVMSLRGGRTKRPARRVATMAAGHMLRVTQCSTVKLGGGAAAAAAVTAAAVTAAVTGSAVTEPEAGQEGLATVAAISAAEQRSETNPAGGGEVVAGAARLTTPFGASAGAPMLTVPEGVEAEDVRHTAGPEWHCGADGEEVMAVADPERIEEEIGPGERTAVRGAACSFSDSVTMAATTAAEGQAAQARQAMRSSAVDAADGGSAASGAPRSQASRASAPLAGGERGGGARNTLRLMQVVEGPGGRETRPTVATTSAMSVDVMSAFASSSAAAAAAIVDPSTASSASTQPVHKVVAPTSIDAASGQAWLVSPAVSAVASVPRLDVLLRACRTVDSAAQQQQQQQPRSRLGGSSAGMMPQTRGSVQGTAAPSGNPAYRLRHPASPLTAGLDGRTADGTVNDGRAALGEASELRSPQDRAGEGSGGSGGAGGSRHASMLELECGRSLLHRTDSSNGGGAMAASFVNGPGSAGGPGSAIGGTQTGGSGGSLTSPVRRAGSGSQSPQQPLHRILLMQQRAPSKSRMSAEMARDGGGSATAAAPAAAADGSDMRSSGAPSATTAAADRRRSLALPATSSRAGQGPLTPGAVTSPVEFVSTTASGANVGSAGLLTSAANSTLYNDSLACAGLGSGGGGVGPSTLQVTWRDSSLQRWEVGAGPGAAPVLAASERLALEATRPTANGGQASNSGFWAAAATTNVSAGPGGRSAFAASSALPIRSSRRLNSLRARVHALLDQAEQVELQRAGSGNIVSGTAFSHSINLSSMRPGSSIAAFSPSLRAPSGGTLPRIHAATSSYGAPPPQSPLLSGGSAAGITAAAAAAAAASVSCRLVSTASARRSSMHVVPYEELLVANGSTEAIMSAVGGGRGGHAHHHHYNHHNRNHHHHHHLRAASLRAPPTAPTSADGCSSYVDRPSPFGQSASVQESSMLQILASMDDAHAAGRADGCGPGDVSGGVRGAVASPGTGMYLQLGTSGGGVAELTTSEGLVSGRAPIAAAAGGIGPGTSGSTNFGAGSGGVSGGASGGVSDMISGGVSGGVKKGQRPVSSADRPVNLCFLTQSQLGAAAGVSLFGQGPMTAPNPSPAMATVTAPLGSPSVDKMFAYGNATLDENNGPCTGSGAAAAGDGSTGILQATLMGNGISAAPCFLERQRCVSLPRAGPNGFVDAAQVGIYGQQDLQEVPRSGAAGAAGGSPGMNHADAGGAGGGNGLWNTAAPAAGAGASSYGISAVPAAVAWCQLRARTCTTVDGRRVLMLIISDVTKQIQDQARVASLVEQEHRILEALFPRHVIAYLTAPNNADDENDSPNTPATSAPRRRGVSPRRRRRASFAELRIGDESIGSERRGHVQLRELALQQHRNTLKVSRLATEHKMVTILFSDIVGFTAFSRQVPPLTVMRFLNELYQKLDALLDIYKVYKVETIGDCYVVAGGLVRYDEDGLCTVLPEGETDELHAVRVMEFAKAMLRASREVALPTTGEPVQVRLGLHSGPAMSGVVGSKMPRFTVFGETVEAAHRMESSGKPGRIHVSGVTKALLRSESWEQTEGVQIDGRGRIDTYLWLEEEEDDAYKQRVMAVYL